MNSMAVVEEFFAALEALDVDRAVSLFADDAVQSMPFAPAGFTDRLEGRDAVACQYGGLRLRTGPCTSSSSCIRWRMRRWWLPSIKAPSS